jgi:hypothetical protein
VVELVKVFSYANGGRRIGGAVPLRMGKGVGWGREWKEGDARGDSVAGGVGRRRLDSGGGALGRRWTREEEDDCLVGLCGPCG